MVSPLLYSSVGICSKCPLIIPGSVTACLDEDSLASSFRGHLASKQATNRSNYVFIPSIRQAPCVSDLLSRARSIPCIAMAGPSVNITLHLTIILSDIIKTKNLRYIDIYLVRYILSGTYELTESYIDYSYTYLYYSVYSCALPGMCYVLLYCVVYTYFLVASPITSTYSLLLFHFPSDDVQRLFLLIHTIQHSIRFFYRIICILKIVYVSKALWLSEI